jgi:pimeloyl-ACP methyl ester carboxylesterase
MPYATRDGVRLFYTDTGFGDPPLLFIHGWACDSTHWRCTTPAFENAHRIATADLRGHGQSDKPQQDYTMAVFCDDVEWLAQQLDLRAPVVVGHSMGGVIALMIARRKKLPLSALVMVDAPLHITISPEEVTGLLNGLDSPAYRDVAQLLVDMRFFRPTSPARLRAELTEALLQTPQHVMASALRNLASEMYPPPAPLDIPALFIDAGRPVDELKRIEEALPGVEIARTNGAGHFNMLEAPGQVNAMLRIFLEQNAGAEASA